jgi:hypothetical protein
MVDERRQVFVKPSDLPVVTSDEIIKPLEENV